MVVLVCLVQGGRAQVAGPFSPGVCHAVVCYFPMQNIGAFTLAFSELVGPSGFVFAFEPGPIRRDNCCL